MAFFSPGRGDELLLCVKLSQFLRSLFLLSLSLSSSLSLQQTLTHSTMSFATTANFFYAVVVAGLAYNVFILYAGAIAAKFALRK